MIYYKGGYKYQLVKATAYYTPVLPAEAIKCTFMSLSLSGYLEISRHYAWDGASGPTFDTKNSMTASLVHDCFCQLIREGKLPESDRKVADIHFRKMCRQAGMSAIRAWIWYQGVRIGAKFNTQKPKRIRKA